MNDSTPLHLNDATLLPYALIEISGPDAEKLLQGQTSIHIARLPVHGVSYGTANTPKGRMYGLFRLIRTGPDSFLLRLQQSCAEAFLRQLGKYAVFFKCQIRHADEYQAWGLFSATEALRLPESSEVAREAEGTYVLRSLTTPALYEVYSVGPVTTTGEFSAEDWAALEAQSGIPELYPSTQEAFILQHLNLQELGAVSFDKGCYTGQEIIARLKYLGKQKKRMYRLHAAARVTTQPGESVYDVDGHKCGEVVRSHYSPRTGSITLAVLEEAFANGAPTIRLSPETAVDFSIERQNP